MIGRSVIVISTAPTPHVGVVHAVDEIGIGITTPTGSRQLFGWRVVRQVILTDTVSRLTTDPSLFDGPEVITDTCPYCGQVSERLETEVRRTCTGCGGNRPLLDLRRQP